MQTMRTLLRNAILIPCLASCLAAGLLSFLLVPLHASAATALVVDANRPKFALAPYVEYIEDPAHELGIKDVAGTQSTVFRPAPHGADSDINFGYSSSTYWLRFTLDAPAASTWLLELSFPSLDHVEFYSAHAGQWQKMEAGDLMPFAARPIANRNFVFPVQMEQAGQQTFYLRVTSAGSLTLPLQLWQPVAFHAYVQNAYAALALYFGMLLALMLYNLMLYFSLRDRSYLAYVALVIAMGIAQASLTGLANQYLWPDWPAWGNVALPGGFALVGVFAALFTRGFLATARNAPWHDRLLVALTWISACAVLSLAVVPYTWSAILVSLLGVVFPVVAVSTGVVCLRGKVTGAPYFLLAWTLMLAGSAVLGLRNLDWLPTNFFTLYSMLIGSGLEILLLSFALAQRIHSLRRKKEQAQSEALATAHNAERELEKRVVERTAALSEANMRLQVSTEYEQNRNLVLEQVAKGQPLPGVLSTLAVGVEQECPGALCSILLLDEEGRCLLMGAAPSLPASFNRAVHGLEIGPGAGTCGNAAYTKQRTIVEDIHTHPSWAAYGHVREEARKAGLMACWSEPIFSSGAEVLGTFAIYWREPVTPSPGHLDVIHRATQLASIAIEQRRLDDAMWQHANFDTLTKLPNRRLFRDRLQQEIKRAQRSSALLALMFIDLDLFKEVNDTLGHDVGDLLLVEVAQRIRACVRSSDTVARISGDEFTVVLPQLKDTDRSDRVAQHILHSLAQPYLIASETIHISASIGITLYPNDAADLESLLKNADQAMYNTKAQGRNNYSYFTRQMQEDAHKRMLLIKDLRDALPAQQLHIYFQPIVNMASGRIVKAEALLRWTHPERGMVSPALFIPVAEEIGLINDIGNWVFLEAARWMKIWHDKDYSCLQVSVNKSPSQFSVERTHADWLDHLQTIALPPGCMVVEITEGFLLQEHSALAQRLLQFRDAGIQVAIDDFGTGYSSLSYLKKFNIDYLKIDQSFVRDMATDPNDLALSEAIIVMAHKLGLKVIAEGVETTLQHDMLAAAGCDYAQGYLYARPMPAAEFDQLLAQQVTDQA